MNSTFEWDESKNKINFDKHGITFEEAQMVFGDPYQCILVDERKSMKIIRIGKTVQGTFGPVTPIDGRFLPKPGELVFKNPTVKVTIALEAESLDFFKKQATKHKTSYQRMIRNLLKEYVKNYKSQSK